MNGRMRSDDDGRPHRRCCICPDCKADRDARWAAIAAEGLAVEPEPHPRTAKQRTAPKPNQRRAQAVAREVARQPEPPPQVVAPEPEPPRSYCRLCGLWRSHWAGCDGVADRSVA